MTITPTIEDGKLILSGPGTFNVSKPVGETITVEDGKVRRRTVPEGVTISRVGLEEDGETISVNLALPAQAAAEPEPAADSADNGRPVPNGARFIRVTDLKGNVLQRTPGPVKFSKDEPIASQDGIGTNQDSEVQ